MLVYKEGNTLHPKELQELANMHWQEPVEYAGIIF
jgi:hypothetical protein